MNVFQFPLLCGVCSAIYMVCSDLDHAAIKALKVKGIKVNLVDGNPGSKHVLSSKETRLQDADSVVLCGLGNKSAADADVQVRPALWK